MTTTSDAAPGNSSNLFQNKKKRWLARLILLATSLFIVLLICEVFVRLFCEPYIMPRWVENAPYGIRRQIANLRGYIKTAKYQHHLNTNSKGFRGTREYPVPKGTNVFRIVALGDSVVDGYGVEDDQTFSALLEKKLSGKRPCEVANLGTPGFSTAEELIQLNNVGLVLQPDMVILGYFINDHFENMTSSLYKLQDGKLVRNTKIEDASIYVRDRLSRIPGYSFLCQHSHLVSFLRNKASSFFRRKIAEKHRLPGGNDTGGKLTPDQIALTAALIDEIIRVCTERQIKVLILNLPMEANGEWIENMPLEQLQLKDRVKVVNVAKEIWAVPDIFTIATKGTYHPKPLGHQLIADWLAPYIEQQVWAGGARP